MSVRRRLDHRDGAAGAAFFVFGIAFAVVALNYPLGTTMRMGPGYFPVVLGLILAGLGVIVGLGAYRRHSVAEQAAGSTSLSIPKLRPALLISASVLVFAVAIESVGLALATFGVVAVSSLANSNVRWRSVTASGLVLASASVAIFAYGLRLPFRVTPF